MKKENTFASIVFLLAVLFAGCSDTVKPISPATPPPGTGVGKTTVSMPTSTATVTSLPTETAAPVYSYNPHGRRDPFTPLIIREEKKDRIGARPPLERYALHEFKLTGIVWGGLGYHAVLEGPDGKGYFVKTGTIVGTNRGVVKKIDQNSLTVLEQFKDPSGEMKKKEIVIELRKKQEGTL